MTKHTPGPWVCTYTSNHAHDYRLSRPKGPMKLDVVANDHSEQRANACLISAAPDMLDVLIEVQALGLGIPSATWTKVWDVIRLAKGQ